MLLGTWAIKYALPAIEVNTIMSYLVKKKVALHRPQFSDEVILQKITVIDN